MSGDLSVSLLLRQRDELSGPLRRTLGGVVGQSREATRSVDAVTDASLRGAVAREQATGQAERAIQRSVDESAAAYSAKEKAATSAERTVQRSVSGSADAERTVQQVLNSSASAYVERARAAALAERTIQQSVSASAASYAEGGNAAAFAEGIIQRSVSASASAYVGKQEVAVTGERAIQRSVMASAVAYAGKEKAAASAELSVQHSVAGSVAAYAAKEKAAASAELAVQRGIAGTAAAYYQEERAAIAAENAIARAANRSIDERLRAQSEFNEALRTLGVRTEHEIQREIERTQRAYERLAESGQLSAEEQARAFGSMRSRVAELTAEIGRLSRAERGIQFGQRIGGGLVRTGELALAGAAATHAVAGPAGRAMDYDRSLALMANTAFNEEDSAGRIRGMKELNEVVRKTIAAGGGTPEQVVEAMTQMLGQNAISHESVFRLMPLLQRYATGTGSDTTELGDVAMRSIQTFGIREDQIQDVLDASIKGGHMGGFHLRQMAKWLPQQMASAKNAGMNGMDGIASLIALNEVSMTTAGTADEAGNNTLDLLQHLNAQDTSRKIKKELGATLSVRYAEAIQHGKGPLEAFAGLINQVMAKDKNYQIIQGKLATTKDDGEKRELYERMEQVIAGSAIGKVIHNRQEMLAMMGYLNNRERYDQIKASVLNARGMGEADAQTMESTDSFKTQRAKSLAELGEFDSLRGFDKVVGNAADRVSQYAEKYPGLMSAIMGTKVAFEGLTSVLMAVGLMRFVTGHGAGAAERGAAKAGSSVLGSVARGTVGEGGLLARFLRPAGSAALSMLIGGAEAWQTAGNDSLSSNEKKSEYTRIAGHTAGGIGGWLGGAATGAAIGSAFPVVGTAAGGIIGGLLGGLGGDLLGDKLGKMLGDAIFKAEAAKPAPQPASVNVKVELDGRQIYESINQMSLEAARRH
ncbi:phage tail tape measure protein [Paraburkholderia unamae]|uniref:Minor tail protein n=1 Tax=Paraburkholderia unamae TaxID=219649 RepID=A0ABX5KHY1_9BURK|nr:phage tail tape measure protein [Paraburkholderia unamae]PVX80056.1 minor tail protein [Paraburkholderia unamae]